jgi:hypothetical protein
VKLSREIVRLFLENAPRRVDQIREARDGEDLEVPERGAHLLKSSAANIGAQQMTTSFRGFGPSSPRFSRWSPRRSRWNPSQIDVGHA